tara:strand:- start:7629 stop:8978 length:1350 start_codon:yes stop_codon:yes gene_type:complete
MADKLSEFGYNFQIKLIASLFTDRAYLQQISDILEPNMFESEANYFIVDTIKKYFQTYKSPPTMEVMKVQVEEIDNDVLKTTVVDHLKDSYKQLESDDLEFVKEKTLMFCKNQKLKKAIIRSVDLLKDNDFESIKTVIDESLKAGSDRDVGHEYLEEIDLRYEESVRNVVTTGWEVIDDLADGGLGKGELGVMVAPAGIGKSWALVNIGANAVKAGLKVIHYTLELNEHYVGLRYDSVFTGIAAQDLKYNIDDVKKRLTNVEGNLIVKYYPTKGASVNSISAHIEKCMVQGFKPDMVIVDYADLLRGSGKSRELRHELGNLYEDLRGIAGEHEIPVWTASQANRSALEEDVIGAEKIAESYAKIMTADFVISLSRKIEDKIAGTGRWHVIKNRFGPDGITLPSKMNASNGQIDIYESDSIQGQETRKDMNNHSEYLRKMMANKYKELDS